MGGYEVTADNKQPMMFRVCSSAVKTDQWVPPKVTSMFRRKPTRIELKVEDLQEYEAMKKQIEQKNSGDDKIEVNQGVAEALEGAKIRASMMNERLGYKPQPRVSN
ncbi:unnamed protein product [Larinioides sclopetarius]|uniref:Anaphase-promoting complex subunit CDC26 n=1 Tax=Larinioides sclopetarius TaxID=280406 RepID=A0AAV1ZLT2_9ARAC